MKQIKRRLQMLEQRTKPDGKLAIVLAVGKTPEQVEQEIAEISTWLPADRMIVVIDR